MEVDHETRRREAPASDTGTRGEKPGTLTYSTYLKVGELIGLQKPLTGAHDEMLFIVIHQAYELWFKQILFELDALIPSLRQQNFIRSFRILERVTAIFKLLVGQVDILETMTPIEFNRFRSNLNPASGFQSAQFRELELLLGASAEEYEKYFVLEPEWKEKLTGRIAKESLHQAFLELLRQRGLLPDDGKIGETILHIYHSGTEQEMEKLCEFLIGLDEQVSLWRFRHVQMVERMIGMRPGTGGSLGVNYLKTTLRKRFFPELWEARTLMGSV